jgi:hypothetical protein
MNNRRPQRVLAAPVPGRGQVCGRTLARAHARTGDAAMISGYLGRGSAFDQAITAFAES